MIAATLTGLTIMAVSGSAAVLAVAVIIWLSPEPRPQGPHVIVVYAAIGVAFALMCGLVLLLAGDRQPLPAPTNPAIRSK
jgi:hypothetical protein